MNKVHVRSRKVVFVILLAYLLLPSGAAPVSAGGCSDAGAGQTICG